MNGAHYNSLGLWLSRGMAYFNCEISWMTETPSIQQVD